jgi:hypothetical protein
MAERTVPVEVTRKAITPVLHAIPAEEPLPGGELHFVALMLYRELVSSSLAVHAIHAALGHSAVDESERTAICSVLREVVGNPFRSPNVSPDWLVWADGMIPKLALAIYEERAFDRLPTLGDAIEESGCADADLLGHLRSSGPHVRGCWALDLILGKQ